MYLDFFFTSTPSIGRQLAIKRAYIFNWKQYLGSLEL